MRIERKDREVDLAPSLETEDPVLAMLGVGKELWEREPGDRFVDRIRSEDQATPAPPVQTGSPTENLYEAVWRRLKSHQRELFHTATKLPFTFAVEGSGIWFFRDGRRINRKLSRTQLNVAISRCPLQTTTEIKDLIDYPYTYAVLMDRRIRQQDW